MAKQLPWTVFWSALNDLDALEGFSERMNLPAEMALEVLMHNIEARQPIGHDEQQKGGTGRVSDRLGHTPIEKGWREDVTAVGDGIKIRVKNISQHFAPVVEGAARHPIYGNPQMIFWWGDPHPWPAPEVSYSGIPMGPGVYAFEFIDHPGQSGNPFVRTAKQVSLPEMRRRIQIGVESYIQDMLESAGLRRVK